MKQAYIKKKFRAETLAQIETANEIIAKYQEMDLRLTLRQLYYQFVAHHGLPNTERSYKNLASVVSQGRLAGLVDWEAIEDRGRVPSRPSEWANIPELIDSALAAYRLPRWAGQRAYVELWVEKQALAGVLEPLAREFHVTLMVNKGYSSQSAMWESANRYLARDARESILLYLGDHDPSGEDMVRDIGDRLRMFGVYNIEVEKVALTMAQIRQHRPPPNPAKLTDPRAGAYIAEHGDQSWEVDALDPDTLAGLIRDAMWTHVDLTAMEAIKAKEEKDKRKLRKLVDAANWSKA